MTNTRDDFWCVIPAGGAGTRLWPLSRAGSPKFLHDLLGSGRTLIQATVDRLTPLAGERLLVVTGRRHAEAVAAQLPEVPSDRILAEPSPRDSMAAIGWAAAVIERHNPEAIIGSFAADHVVGDPETFRAMVSEAVAVARHDYVVTLGIRPTYPATGFGYIHEGASLEYDDAPHARSVVQFVEKPDAVTARRYVGTGEFRWNAGMFVVKARVLLDLLAQWHPDLAAGLRRIAAEPERLEQEWDALEKIAIDHAVAEPAADEGRVAVVRCDVPWDDIGDFHSLAGLLAVAARDDDADAAASDLYTVGPADVLGIDSTGIVASRSDRLVSVVGVEDIVVVDTPDALLVTTRGRAQHVKKVVDRLKAEGRTDLT
ncbi:mannose-1-phosphate guanylyltransferase [Mobilicoccus caccae]|nr:mannose-1-phosphate guanylyltransferase [Mobilicoccus caccae]